MTDAEQERARVVVWLRAQSKAGERACINAVAGSNLERDLAAGVVALTRAANALGRGDHLKGVE